MSTQPTYQRFASQNWEKSEFLNRRIYKATQFAGPVTDITIHDYFANSETYDEVLAQIKAQFPGEQIQVHPGYFSVVIYKKVVVSFEKKKENTQVKKQGFDEEERKSSDYDRIYSHDTDESDNNSRKRRRGKNK